MRLLNELVRLVQLQFSFTNPAAVPEAVKSFKTVYHEGPERQEIRQNQQGGSQFINETHNCSVAGFGRQLEAAGYKLVDALYQPRTKDSKAYNMVRFTFCRWRHVQSSKLFLESESALLGALRELCHTAIWRVRAFDNPYYLDGTESLFRAFSINMEVRTPLLLPDGRPITAWKKTADGTRIGKGPTPLLPSHILKVCDNRIEVRNFLEEQHEILTANQAS